MEENNRREQVKERNAFVKKINDLDEEKNSLEEEITELELMVRSLLWCPILVTRWSKFSGKTVIIS